MNNLKTIIRASIAAFFLFSIGTGLCAQQYDSDWTAYDSKKVGDGEVVFYRRFKEYSLSFKVENRTTNIIVDDFIVTVEMTWATNTQSKTYTEEKSIDIPVRPGRSQVVVFDRPDYSKIKSYSMDGHIEFSRND